MMKSDDNKREGTFSKRTTFQPLKNDKLSGNLYNPGNFVSNKSAHLTVIQCFVKLKKSFTFSTASSDLKLDRYPDQL